MKTKPSAKNLIWLDMEMTGLVVETDKILEIAVIITNNNLEILAESPVYAVHQSDEVLNAMDEWNQTHHRASGLIERVRESKYTESMVEKELLDFVATYVPPERSPMCGNTIYQDRKFIHKWMPYFEKYFHYRNLDVSTLKMLAKYWRPDLAKQLNKISEHSALADIRDSINELKFYRDNFLKLT